MRGDEEVVYTSPLEDVYHQRIAGRMVQLNDPVPNVHVFFFNARRGSHLDVPCIGSEQCLPNPASRVG